MSFWLKLTKRFPLTLGTLLVCALVWSGQPATGQPITKVLENETVQVVRTTQRPHEKQSWPRQEVDGLIVYLQSGTQEITFAGGAKATTHFEAGDVQWMPSSGAYTTEITSADPVTQVVIYIRKPESEGGPNVRKFAPSKLDPLAVASDQYSLILENKRVRVMSAKSAPGQATKPHEHTASRAVVYLTDMKMKVDDAGGSRVATHKAGDVSWNPPAKHVETNLSETPFEAVVVEIK